VGAAGDWEDADGESGEDGDVEEDAGVRVRRHRYKALLMAMIWEFG
jgi:hypothetical protein